MTRYRRRRFGGANPLLQMLLLLMIISVIGVLSYRQLNQLRASSMVDVVVAAGKLPQGTVLVADNLELSKVHKDSVPNGAYQRISDVEGRKLNGNRRRGEILLTRDLTDIGVKKEVYMSDYIPEGRLLTTVNINQFTIPLSSLRTGDRVDILTSGEVKLNADKSNAQIAVRDAYVVAHIKSNGAKNGNGNGHGSARANMIRDLTTMPGKKTVKQQALILAVKPEYVLSLARLQETKSKLRLIVHSRKSVEDGNLLAYSDHKVAPEKHVVEVIFGPNTEKVEFE